MFEYLAYMDHNKYHDTMPTRKVGLSLGGGVLWATGGKGRALQVQPSQGQISWSVQQHIRAGALMQGERAESEVRLGVLLAGMCCSTIDNAHMFTARLQISGSENAEFVTFSSNALKSAQARLRAFLALLPSDQLQAAQQQIASQEL
jgi:hypothetical protein